MQNPLRGIFLNNRYYNYIADSYSETVPFSNSATRTIDKVRASVNGATGMQITVSIVLENETEIAFGSSIVGITTWLGVSQRSDFLSYISAKGESMPLLFINPSGITMNVIPTGSLNIAHRHDVPKDEGVEYRIDMTLDVI